MVDEKKGEKGIIKQEDEIKGRREKEMKDEKGSPTRNEQSYLEGECVGGK